ncbi:hypothetical protein SAMN05421847_0469 [Halpernia humi]|uniref:Uncharacterized protein n=1 Tax=Halpernia humi TaxID=493375 RepID=A0A1H5TGM1_9FLAO|nr:hypothetical protein SAMN05421847_0469 [Halpernia humi]
MLKRKIYSNKICTITMEFYDDDKKQKAFTNLIYPGFLLHHRIYTIFATAQNEEHNVNT